MKQILYISFFFTPLSVDAQVQDEKTDSLFQFDYQKPHDSLGLKYFEIDKGIVHWTKPVYDEKILCPVMPGTIDDGILLTIPPMPPYQPKSDSTKNKKDKKKIQLKD